MKKTLLLIATVAAAMTASAQTSYNFMNVKNDAGENKYDGTDIPAGEVLVDANGIKMTTAYDEPLKVFTPSRAPYEAAAVGSSELVKLEAGVTGNNNPKGQEFHQVATSGMVYKIEVTKNGVVTIFTKMNTNKNYWAFEGETSFAPYRLGFAYTDINFSYTIPYNEDGYVDENSADFAKYFDVNEDGSVKGPKVPWAVYNPDGENLGEGTGFIQLAVYGDEAEPGVYFVFAQGSKMSTDGVVFTEMEEPSLSEDVLPSVEIGGFDKTTEEGTTPAPEIVKFPGKTYDVISTGGAGIDNIASDVKAAELDWNAPVYNVMGQKVSKNFKGIAIQNGAKFIVK